MTPEETKQVFTYKELKEKLEAKRINLATRHGEYRVNLFDGTEDSAYYTDDLQDAYGTALKMIEADKPRRIKELDEQITALINEYYELVAPTEAENEEAADLVADDKDEANCLVDPVATVGKLYLADNVVMYREMMSENENEEKQS